MFGLTTNVGIDATGHGADVAEEIAVFNLDVVEDEDVADVDVRLVAFLLVHPHLSRSDPMP